MQPGGQAVFRLVQQVEAVLPDVPGEIQKGALAVGLAGHIPHQLVIHVPGAGVPLGLHHLPQLVQVLQGPHLHAGIALVLVLRQQFPASALNVLVHAAQVQQIVEDVVTGDDPAVGQHLPVKSAGSLCPAQVQISPVKGAAVEYRPPLQRQLFAHQVQKGGLAAAVAAAEDGDGLQLQLGEALVLKNTEGISAAVAGALRFRITAQKRQLPALIRQ